MKMPMINKRIIEPAVLWGIIGGFVLVFETAFSQIFNPSLFYMFKALPLYEIFFSMALLLAVYFACPFIGGCIFYFLISKRLRRISVIPRALQVRLILIVCILLILEILLPKAYAVLSAPKGEENGAKVILVTIDTLRADHATSTSIDRLAKEGVSFKQAISPCPLTNPTHSSILTGLYPQTHGVRDTAVLDTRWDTLQRIFKRNGYDTAAFVSGFVLKDFLSGMSSDFDLYEDRFSLPFDGFKLMRVFERLSILPVSNLDRKAGLTNKLVIPWIKSRKNRKFFLWMHYYDPHLPYEPPQYSSQRGQWGMRGSKRADLSDEVIGEMLRRYDGEISYADRCLGEVMDVLDKLGIEHETLVVLTSDHGEGFDHDYYFDHGDRLYDSGIHVPLIFRYPKGGVSSGREVRRQVQLVDIAPTILSLTGLKQEMETEGEDLTPLLYSNETSIPTPGVGMVIPPAYSESPRRNNPASAGPLRCIRTGDWKYIFAVDSAAEELYNIKDDPLEEKNLVTKEKETAAMLKKDLFRWMKDEGRGRSEKKPVLDGDTREKLRSLGYLQ